MGLGLRGALLLKFFPRGVFFHFFLFWGGVINTKNILHPQQCGWEKTHPTLEVELRPILSEEENTPPQLYVGDWQQNPSL